ncbi:hypothetical protein C0J52_05895 [Blattella germanica]|nr:hypothetical protein C0J52_05895 [Blattella germanica]
MKTRQLVGAVLLCWLLYGASRAEHAFRPRQEYNFVLEGRTVAGFPELGNQKHAGVLYSGHLRIQRDTTTSILMRFQNMTYTNLHEDLPGGWWSEAEKDRAPAKNLPITTSTISVKYHHYEVESVAVRKGLEKWEINFIQGVVNQLQVGAHIGTKLKGKQANASYKTKENSIFGKCEISFEISKVPRLVALTHPNLFPKPEICGGKNFYEIFKTRNFSNCENDPKYHFGLPKSKRCTSGGNECEDFWSRASVTRLSGCGDRSDFEILQSEVNTRMISNLHLHNGSQASVSSYLSLNLKSVKPISKHLSAPIDPDVFSDLKFQYLSFKEEEEEEAIYDEFPIDVQDDDIYVDEDIQPSPQIKTHKKHLSSSKSKTKTKVKTKPATMEATPTMPPKDSTSGSLPEIGKLERSKRSSLYDHMHLEYPPVQPLSPLVQGVRQNDLTFNTIQKLRELITDASNELEVPGSISDRMTPETIVYAVRLCRTMSYIDLSKTAAIISLQAKSNRMLQTERKLLRDVLVMCGTNPSFLILKAWLENRELIGEEASEVIAAMPLHLQTPEAQTVTEFYALVRELANRDCNQLKTSAILAFSNLVRIACVEKEVRESRYYTKSYRELCKEEDLEIYVSWFMSGVTTAGPLRRVFITALGNTGNVTVLSHLKAVALDSSVSTYIRTTAVYSMKYQVLNYPEEASNVLFSLYRNVGLPVPVRIAAVSLLFYAKLSLVSMQRIAVSTWYDPSLAVAAFIRSSFISLSKVEDPAFQSIARHARTAMPLTRPVALGLHMPHNFLWSKVSKDLQEVILTQVSLDPSLEPTNLYFRYTQRHGGFSRVVVEGDVFVSNLDLLFTNLRELVYPSEDVTLFRPVIRDLNRSTKWIKENLKISERSMPRFEGDLHFLWDKLHERMLPMNNELFVDLAKGGRKLIEQMGNAHIFNYQKVNQKSMIIQVITELGFPVTFEMVVPWAFRLTTNTKINVTNKLLEMDVGIVYTTQLISELSFYTGWDGTIHMAGSHGLSLLNPSPMKVMAAVRPEVNGLELSFSSSQPMFESVLMHHSTKVFTSQHNVLNLNPNTLKESTSIYNNDINLQKAKSIIPNTVISYTPGLLSDSPLMWFKKTVSVMGFFMIWPTLETGTLELQLESFEPMTLLITLDHASKDIDTTDMSTNANKKTIEPETEDTTTKSMEEPASSTSRPPSTPTTTTTPTAVTRKEKEGRFNYFRDRLVSVVGPPIENLKIVANETNTTSTIHSTPMTTPTSTILTSPATTPPYITFTFTIPVPIPDSTKPPLDHDIDVRRRRNASKHFNASAVDPFMLEPGRIQVTYLLQQMLGGFSFGKAYVLGLQFNCSGNHYRTYLTQSTGNSDKQQKYGIFMLGKKHERVASKMLLTSTLQSNVSPMLSLKSVILTNLSATLNADMVLQRNNVEYIISAKTLMGRCQESLDLLNDNQCVGTPESDISPICLRKAVNAMFFDMYNLTVTYNQESKVFGPTLKRAFNYFRYWMLPYMTEDEDDTYHKAPANSINGVLKISPQRDHVNMWIRSQNTETEFNNIPVNSNLGKFLLFNPAVGYARRLAGESRRTEGNELEIEVNLDDYMVLSLRPRLDVQVNNVPVDFVRNVAEFKDEAGTILTQLERSSVPEHAAESNTMSRLCGICGDNNGDIANDFMNPHGNLELTAKNFCASYALNDLKAQPQPSSET